MIYTTTTQTPLSEVKAAMQATAKENAFGVLHQYAFKEILEGKGFPIENDITLYEVCNPKGAQALLSQSQEASVFLPCRVSIYEENGQTVLGTIKLENFIDSLNATEELKASLQTLYKDIIKLLNSF